MVGFLVCIWIAIGSVIDVRPTIQLPVYTNHCSHLNVSEQLKLLNMTQKEYMTPGSYHPEGLNYLYHMSYWLVPAFGFCITFVLGILFGLLRTYLLNKEDASTKYPEKVYVSPLIRKFFYKEEQKSINSNQFEGIQLNGFNNDKGENVDKQLDI